MKNRNRLLAGLAGILSFILPLNPAMADSLKIDTGLGNPKAPYTGRSPVTFDLTLDLPSETAKLEFSLRKRKFSINRSPFLELRKKNPLHFSGTLERINEYYSPAIENGGLYPADQIDVTPVIVRNGKEIRLPAVRFPNPLQCGKNIQITDSVEQSSGKFGDSISFDGKTGLALVQKIPFDPEQGSIEGWLFMPSGVQEQNAVILQIASRDSDPWSYQRLYVYGNSRRLRYFCYDNGTKQRRSILSRPLEEPQWIHFLLAFSLREKKMELFVNGKSEGTAPYTTPAGGRKSRLTLGGTIAGNEAASCCYVMLDDIRISNVPRSPSVPAAPSPADSHTLLLLPFDGDDFLSVFP